MSPYTAESSRLYLQPWIVEEHLQDYHELMSDPTLARWSYREPSPSLEISQKYMETRLPSDEKPYMENYAILLKGSGAEEGRHGKLKMIGAVGIARLSEEGGEMAEIGYGILESRWGRGYATEAVGLFVENYWRGERKVQKEVIQAVVEPENVASMKVLEKVGFKKGSLNEKAYEVEDLKTREMKWVKAYPFYLERPRK